MFIATVRRLALVLVVALGLIVLTRPVGLPRYLGAIFVVSGLLAVWWTLDHRWRVSPELDAALLEAERLRKTDPVAADQLLDKHFEKAAARSKLEREELRRRAQHDLYGAKQLETLLRHDLEDHRVMRRRAVPTIPFEKRAAALSKIDEMERQTRSELDLLRASIRLLKR